MKRLACLFVCLQLLSSCTNKHLSNDQLILGDWVKVKTIKKYKSKDSLLRLLELPDFYTPGYTFYPNHIVDNKIGYYKNDLITFLGNTSKFNITNNTLSIFRPDSNKWCTFKLILLNKDTLKLNLNGNETTFKHYSVINNPQPQFDQIVLSKSPCMGICPITNTIINSDGNVLFCVEPYVDIDRRYFTGKISKKHFLELEGNFNKIDFDSLKSSYISSWTDDETTTITFLKNGKIFKSVLDYGRRAPYLFTWAYVALQNLHQTIPLKNIKYPAFLPQFDVFGGGELWEGNLLVDLKQSELFLLFSYFKSGKISKAKFKPRFVLKSYNSDGNRYDLNTDGRYYTFMVKGKPLTIDIGFNFYDVNEKIWVWRKATEYD